jgi:hypothetical protein
VRLIKRALLLGTLLVAGCGLVDLSPFTVSTWPATPDGVVASASSVWIEFSEPVEKDVVEPLFSVGAGGQTLGGDLSWSGNRLTFTPLKPFAPGVRHLLQLHGTIRTSAGRSFDELVVVPYYVGTDAAPPVVMSATPSEGAVTSVTTPLVLTFSQPVSASSFTDAFSVSPTASFTVSWSPDGTVATVTPTTRWVPESLSTWTVATACKSAAGIAVQRAWSGTFLVQSDAVSPTVVSTESASISGGTVLTGLGPLSALQSGDSLVMNFSEDVDAGTLQTAFSLTPTVAGTLRKLAPGSFAWVPSDPWLMGQEYLLAISTDLKDMAGTPLAVAYREPFTTAVPTQTVTNINLEGSLTGTLPLAAPLNNAAPYLLPWVNSGVVQDSALVLTVTYHFARPYDAASQITIAAAIRMTGYFPSSVVSPQVLGASWLDPTTFRVAYIGFKRSDNSPSLQRRYYRISIPSGRDQTVNQEGAYLKDPVTVILESGSDS